MKVLESIVLFCLRRDFLGGSFSRDLYHVITDHMTQLMLHLRRRSRVE